jgi:hypothetical protein
MALYGGRDLLGSMMPHIARGPSLAATKQFEASLAGNDVMRERRSRASLSTAEQLRGFQMAEGEAVDEAAQGAILGAGTDINPVARQHDALQNLIGLHAPGSDFAQQQRRQHLINMMARQLQAKAGFSDEQLSSLGVEPRTFEEDRRTTHENRMTPGQNARLVEAFRQKGVDFTGEFIQALSRVETELKKQTAIAEKQGNAPLPAAPPAGMPLR